MTISIFTNKVQLLVDQCNRTNAFGELLQLIKDSNPRQYETFQSSLQKSAGNFPFDQPIGESLEAKGQLSSAIQVFISYSRKDINMAQRLAEDLQKAGFAVWWDVSDLKGGDSWGRTIQAALEASKICLVLLSPASVHSEWVEREYLYAMHLNLKIIPLFYQDCKKPLALMNKQHIDFQHNYQQGLNKLFVALGEGSITPNPVYPTQNKNWFSRGNLMGLIIGAILALIGLSWIVFYMLPYGPGFVAFVTPTQITPTDNPTIAASTETPTPTPVPPTHTPFPTLTSTSTPTLTSKPTSTSDSPESLLDAVVDWPTRTIDNFNDNRNEWPIGEQLARETEKANITINGKYYVDVTTTDGATWRPFYSKIAIPKQFFLEVIIKRTREDGCDAGLVWETVNGYYLFRIDDIDQEYSFLVYDRISDNSYDDKINWTRNDIIKTEDFNRLSVINDGYKLYFYINGLPVGQSINTFSSEGRVGLRVSVCNDNSQVTFEFDNLELRIPPPQFFALAPSEDLALIAFNQGIRNFHKERYSEAIESFQQAISSKYSHPEVIYYYIGRAQAAQNEHTKAIQNYEIALEKGDEMALEKGYHLAREIYNRLGLSHSANKEYDLAIDNFTQALNKDHPQPGWVYYNRGDAYREMDNHEQQAIDDYGRAIKEDYLYAYRKLGWIYVNQGKYQQAITEYTTAIEKKVNDEFLYYDRGTAHKAAGNKDKAIQDFKAYISQPDASDEWKKNAQKEIDELEQ